MKQDNFDFGKAVLERSSEVPIVVDYWSPTCGPCLFLGPILEKLESQSEGKWELVKINTNEHNDLAYEHGIHSIPHVKMFSKGKLVSEFVGALPEGTLVKWLDEFIPTEAKEELNAIRERLAGDDREKALADLADFITAHPEIPMASLLLASEVVFENPERAIELVSVVKNGDLHWNGAENVKILAEIRLFHDAEGTEAGKQLALGSEALKQNDFEGAIQALLSALEADKAIAKELPRRGAIALLRMFGPQHPLTLKYRRRLEMALN